MVLELSNISDNPKGNSHMLNGMESGEDNDFKSLSILKDGLISNLNEEIKNCRNTIKNKNNMIYDLNKQINNYQTKINIRNRG